MESSSSSFGELVAVTGLVIFILLEDLDLEVEISFEIAGTVHPQVSSMSSFGSFSFSSFFDFDFDFDFELDFWKGRNRAKGKEDG